MKSKCMFIAISFLFAFSSWANPSTSSQEMIKKLEQRRAEVYKWMLLCEGEFEGQISESPGICKQIDVVEFAGAACFSAQLAGDDYIVKERCRDVSLGQDAQGRWWRGQSNINQTTENSFSRDMMSGLINYFLSQGYFSKDPAANEKAREQAMLWVEWIEKYGGGKRMCDDDKGLFNNRCSIKGNNVLYYTLKAIGAITKDNQNYKTIRKLSKNKGLNGWEFETFFTPASYQLYLKAHKLYQKYILDMIDERQYQKIAKIIYKKNPLNPWHEFMYLGPTEKVIERTLKLCPEKRPTRGDWTLSHYSTGDFAWQRATDDKAWEVADGHDCVTLINWQIAALKGNIFLPFKTAKNDCGLLQKELGAIENKKVCLPKLFKTISGVRCTEKNGILWKNSDQEYCLQDLGKYYFAKKLTRDCPVGYVNEGEFRDMPLCKPKVSTGISLYRCIRSNAGDMHGPANHVIREDGEVRWCNVYKETWFKKKRINSFCPIGTSFENEFMYGNWPVCKGILRVKKEKCTEPLHVAKDNYCLYRQKGWVSKRLYK